ncbi:replication initiation protein (plasmid) [Fusobacterium polymorphum ATCC 10953]|jgi:hypothetical protein|uniref:Possible replication protein n=2 Tax=Fusobacterium TaxID=848 RepID=A5VW45_FUSNP|nr:MULTISPECIES: replication initiation protein [Fusobacterium]ABQ59636.1 possible replication protein [Fusobacterium polymorphum ATCC 10953]ETZ24949.1 hypothetical protein HMPREF2085_02495 [Fusobacterium nucleatum 13_3C]WRL69667.1 replication initiation protein [Fusobacterium polymorphum]
MKKKDDDLIIVSKDFINLRYGYFKSVEILLFYRILLAGKNLKKDNNVIIEDFSIVQKDLEIKAKDLKKEIFAIQDNFLRTKIKYANRNGVGTVALFEGIYNNIKDNTIEAILTSRGKEFLQNLSDGYIRFLFTDVLKFKSKYSRLILPHLMNVSHLRKFIVNKEKLLEIFEIEEKDGYNNLSNFNRVVLKAVKSDLKDIFEDFKITKNKEGRTIKEYIFTWSNNFNFKKDFSKEEETIDYTDEIIEKSSAELTELTELTAEETIKKFIKENIPTLNYKSIQKNIKNRLENGETPEEIIAFIKRNWHRAIDDDKYKSKIGILKKALEENFELNLTKEEIQREKNILNGKTIVKKEVKVIKSDWDTPNSSKAEEKEEEKKEVVKEKKIEIISYKEYLERKEIELKKIIEKTKTGDKKLDLALRKMNFFLVFKGKIQVNLTKTEYEQETENLKKYFQVSLEIIKQEVERIFIITKEKEEEVKEETKVAVAEVVEKNNAIDEEAILKKVSKSLLENATEIKGNDTLSKEERKEKLLKMLRENIELLEKETEEADQFDDIASIFKK